MKNGPGWDRDATYLPALPKWEKWEGGLLRDDVIVFPKHRLISGWYWLLPRGGGGGGVK